MGTFNYQKFVTIANKQIARFGAICQLARGADLIDVNALLDISVTETTLDQNMVRATDRICILPATAFDPLTSEDKIIIGGVTYQIKNPQSTGPGGTTVLWTLIARL